MANKVRINLANPMELEELPGVGPEEANAIIRFRAEHGPISAPQLSMILGAAITDSIWQQVDFDPAGTTAPEAPGA